MAIRAYKIDKRVFKTPSSSSGQLSDIEDTLDLKKYIQDVPKEGLDVNGHELILDADADTSITADTDDRIDIKVSGADDFRITANTFTALSGSTIATNTIAETTAASGVTIDGVILKDGGVSLGTSAVSTFTVLKTITAAEIVGTAAGDLGHANGVELVAAPGAGFALQFVDAVAIYDFDTAAYTGGGNDTTINIGSGGAAITGVVTSANLIGAAGDKIVRFDPLSTAALPMSVNTGISMNSVTAWTQPGTAAGVLRVYTTYRVITTGL